LSCVLPAPQAEQEEIDRQNRLEAPRSVKLLSQLRLNNFDKDIFRIIDALPPVVSGSAKIATKASGFLSRLFSKLFGNAALRLPRSLSAAVNITTRSRIKDSPFAIRLAQKLSQSAQRDVDKLLSALKSGNANPGIGTRALGNSFFELRGSNAGRVIIKQTSSGSFDIVGKFQGHARGDAANSAIIQRFIKIGGG